MFDYSNIYKKNQKVSSEGFLDNIKELFRKKVKITRNIEESIERVEKWLEENPNFESFSGDVKLSNSLLDKFMLENIDYKNVSTLLTNNLELEMEYFKNITSLFETLSKLDYKKDTPEKVISLSKKSVFNQPKDKPVCEGMVCSLGLDKKGLLDSRITFIEVKNKSIQGLNREEITNLLDLVKKVNFISPEERAYSKAYDSLNWDQEDIYDRSIEEDPTGKTYDSYTILNYLEAAIKEGGQIAFEYEQSKLAIGRSILKYISANLRN